MTMLLPNCLHYKLCKIICSKDAYRQLLSVNPFIDTTKNVSQDFFLPRHCKKPQENWHNSSHSVLRLALESKNSCAPRSPHRLDTTHTHKGVLIVANQYFCMSVTIYNAVKGQLHLLVYWSLLRRDSE